MSNIQIAVDENIKRASKETVSAEEDVKRELQYCTDVFMLMKTGDRIKCDCGSKDIALTFEKNMCVYKDGSPSPAENNIPSAIEAHSKNCFGICRLEEPSRHPGKNKTGGNLCEPYIVGASCGDKNCKDTFFLSERNKRL